MDHNQGRTSGICTSGRNYFLHEELPPLEDGYVSAEDVSFEVKEDGTITKVEMKDDVTKVQISKTDISGKELPGAKLTILDKDGKTVESWTSEKKPHYIEMLPIGEYTSVKKLHRMVIWLQKM